jgi:hypothetical protein
MPLERCKAFVSGIFGISEFSYLSILFGLPIKRSVRLQLAFASLPAARSLTSTNTVPEWLSDRSLPALILA